MLHIDGDALVYIAGHQADSHSGPFSHSAQSVKLIINKALKVTEERDYRIFLTSTRPEVNFRTKIYPEYKKNRSKKCKKCNKAEFLPDTVVKKNKIVTDDKIHFNKKRCYICANCDSYIDTGKPVYYNKLRAFLKHRYGAIICKWGEADDWLGVRNPDWIATHDKDIYQLGDTSFYNLKSGEVLNIYDQAGKVWINEKRQLKGYGFKWFCMQMLLGDSVDNIPKPYKGDGPVFIMKIFEPLTTMREYWEMVKLYYKFTGNNDMLEIVSQLLWVSRERKQRGTLDIIENFIEDNEYEENIE